MKILFVDCETTGLAPDSDRVVELGCVLYCTEEKRIIRSMCFILNDGEIKITEEITKVNFISQGCLEKYSFGLKAYLEFITDAFVEQADYICAHNAPFDKAFIEAELKRVGLSKWERPWIDTCVDIPYSDNISTRKLSYLAVEHGFLNPFPHTALSDALTTCILFNKYLLTDIIARKNTPNITIRAMVDYNTREKASKRGYRWEPSSKRWLKQIKENELASEKEKSDFQIEVLK